MYLQTIIHTEILLFMTLWFVWLKVFHLDILWFKVNETLVLWTEIELLLIDILKQKWQNWQNIYFQI